MFAQSTTAGAPPSAPASANEPDAPVTTSPSSTPAASQTSQASTTVYSLTPSSTVCPIYHGSQVTDLNKATYSVECGTAYNGTVIIPSSSKRQVILGYTVLDCTNLCDSYLDCIAFTLTVAGHCTMFSAISGRMSDEASVDAFVVARAVLVPGSNSIVASSVGSGGASSTSSVALGGPSLAEGSQATPSYQATTSSSDTVAGSQPTPHQAGASGAAPPHRCQRIPAVRST